MRKLTYDINSKKLSNVVPEMKNVSHEAKALISRILMPDGKRMTCEEVFRDPWVMKEAPKTPLKVDFSKMVGFSKYSKVILT